MGAASCCQYLWVHSLVFCPHGWPLQAGLGSCLKDTAGLPKAGGEYGDSLDSKALGTMWSLAWQVTLEPADQP